MDSTIAPVAVTAPAVVRRGATSRISITVRDCDTNAPVDAKTLTLNVLAPGERIIFSEDFFQPYIPPFYHRIIKPTGTIGQYYIDWGDLAFPAEIDAVGGTYPTGFVGGEVLRLQVDNQIPNVVFQSTDQTLQNVVDRINGVFGPLIGQKVAFVNSGQLVLKSRGIGQQGQLQIIPNATSPGVLTTLGLGAVPFGYIYGATRTQESTCSETLLFIWKATSDESGSSYTESVQSVHIIPSVVYQLIPQLRLFIDKSNKSVNLDDNCLLGYTDVNLIQYLIAGLQTINAYQPYPTFSFDSYPYNLFGNLLVESAFLCGVMSQTLYAIDTDVPSFSDQGTSFVINHQQSLAQFCNFLSQKLDKEIPAMKLHLIRSGHVLTEMGPNYRLQGLLDAAPNGSLFRGIFFKG